MEKLDLKTHASSANTDGSQIETLFTFWNGDEYRGQYSTLKEKQRIVRDGKGVYKTADNQIYEGLWENDDLKEAKNIIYSDRSEFSGTLEDMIIQGPGKIRYKENVEIEGDFLNNSLNGKVYLRDPTNHLWKAEVTVNDIFGFFSPLHPFWQSVLNLQSENKLFYDEGGEEAEELADFF